MPNLVTVGVAIASLVLGWALKTWTDARSWRRQQVLEAYLELLDAVDRYGLLATAVWRDGQVMDKRTAEWVTRAQDARQRIGGVDRAHGKLSLVAGWKGASVGADLYVACERMFRRAISVPPTTADRYQSASTEMVRLYNEVVNVGREEMGLRNWRERLPFGTSRFDLIQRRIDQLEESDPVLNQDPPSRQTAPDPPQDVMTRLRGRRPPG